MPDLKSELQRILGVDHAGGSGYRTAICMIEEDGTVTELEAKPYTEIVFLSPEHRQILRTYFAKSSIEIKMLDHVEKLEAIIEDLGPND